jgi:hypothetical protein
LRISSFITPPVQPGNGPGKIQTASGKKYRSKNPFPDAIGRQGSSGFGLRKKPIQ